MLNNLGRILENHILNNIPSIEAVLLKSKKEEVSKYANSVILEFVDSGQFKKSKTDYMATVYINVYTEDDIKNLELKRKLDKIFYEFTSEDANVKIFSTSMASNKALGYVKKYERYTSYNTYIFGLEDLI